MFSSSRDGDFQSPYLDHVTATKSRRHIALILLTFCTLGTARADDAAFFREYIEPLLQNSCCDCQSHDSGEASGGLVLDSKAGWSVGGDSAPAIVPKELDKSLLWRVVNYEVPGLEMPPDGKFPESDRVLIKKWIESGAVDLREDGRAAERKKIDIEAGRQWWAFRPPLSKEVATDCRHHEPRGGDFQSPHPSHSSIDNYIYSKLNDSGLQPSKRSDSATLLRRVSYDLTGLPPEPNTTSHFDLSNQDHYAQYVDSLIASDGFGEKWGRHWLDVARYADSNGSSFNVPSHDA
jgi:hypothetical protein